MWFLNWESHLHFVCFGKIGLLEFYRSTVMINQTKRPLRFLRLKQVIARTGLSRSSIYLMIANGQFPRQINLSGSRSVAWIEAEVEAWMKTRIEISRN